MPIFLPLVKIFITRVGRPYNKMKNDSFVIKVGVISCLLVTSLFIFLITGSWINILKVMFPSVLLCTIIIWFIDNYLWKFKLTKSFFGNLPNLNGEWLATVQKASDNDFHTMKVIIKQTWSNIHLEFSGDRVTSQSTMARLIQVEGSYQLKYMWCGHFNKEYKPKVFGKLEGAAILDFYHESDTLRGIYWTYVRSPKNSIGDMTFNRVN